MDCSTGLPWHPLAVGMIVYFTTPSVVPVLVKTSAMVVLHVPVVQLPLPSTEPLIIWEVHVKVVAVTLAERIIETAEPEQIAESSGVAEATGVGLMVIVKVWGVPEQVTTPCSIVGVTVMVAVRVVSELVAGKAGMSPWPLASNPIEGLLLVQL